MVPGTCKYPRDAKTRRFSEKIGVRDKSQRLTVAAWVSLPHAEPQMVDVGSGVTSDSTASEAVRSSFQRADHWVRKSERGPSDSSPGVIAEPDSFKIVLASDAWVAKSGRGF